MMTDETKKALYAQDCAKVFCNAMSISHASFHDDMRFVDNTQALAIDGACYEARGFDFVPPAPSSDDASAEIRIDDTDRVLSQAFQQMPGGEALLSIGMVRADEPDIWVDGPYEYKVESFAKDSASGTAALSLSRLAPLDCEASGMRYTAAAFPGLFG